MAGGVAVELLSHCAVGAGCDSAAASFDPLSHTPHLNVCVYSPVLVESLPKGGAVQWLHLFLQLLEPVFLLLKMPHCACDHESMPPAARRSAASGAGVVLWLLCLCCECNNDRMWKLSLRARDSQTHLWLLSMKWSDQFLL